MSQSESVAYFFRAAERAEQLAYNALPATFTSDMWAHQYLQQDNEMNAVVSPDHVWRFDGPDSTTLVVLKLKQ